MDGSGSTFEGKITSINKRATVSGDLSYYIATVDLKGLPVPTDALPGMQITAKVLNKQTEKAVLLKMDAVGFTTRNTPYVLMQDGDKIKAVDIKVGINDGTFVRDHRGAGERRQRALHAYRHRELPERHAKPQPVVCLGSAVRCRTIFSA